MSQIKLNSIEEVKEFRDGLQTRYDQAVERGEDAFHYEGHGLLTGYAKHLLEHLTNEVQRHEKK